MTYLLAAIIVAAATSPLWAPALQSAGIFGGRRRRTVVVHTNDRRSIRGVLVHEGALKLVLEHADFLVGVKPAPFSGRAVIPRTNVSWWQELVATDVAGAYRDPTREAE